MDKLPKIAVAAALALGTISAPAFASESPARSR